MRWSGPRSLELPAVGRLNFLRQRQSKPEFSVACAGGEAAQGRGVVVGDLTLSRTRYKAMDQRHESVVAYNCMQDPDWSTQDVSRLFCFL